MLISFSNPNITLFPLFRAFAPSWLCAFVQAWDLCMAFFPLLQSQVGFHCVDNIYSLQKAFIINTVVSHRILGMKLKQSCVLKINMDLASFFSIRCQPQKKPPKKCQRRQPHSHILTFLMQNLETEASTLSWHYFSFPSYL